MNNDVSKKVINRLHRTQGQIRGIEKMIDKGESLEKIITQMSAVASAITSTKKVLVREYIDQEYQNFRKEGNDTNLDNLKSVIDRYME